jgi:hypothetical protein
MHGHDLSATSNNGLLFSVYNLDTLICASEALSGSPIAINPTKLDRRMIGIENCHQKKIDEPTSSSFGSFLHDQTRPDDQISHGTIGGCDTLSEATNLDAMTTLTTH